MVKPDSGKKLDDKRKKNAVRQSQSKRPFYIGLGILLVAGIATLSYLAAKPSEAVVRMDSTITPIANQGHAIGSDSAPLEVVEFGDFECPACGSFATLTEPDVRARLVNTGKIRFRFMDFPLNVHKNTWSGHRGAWCAGDQNKFWEMHDVLFQNQDRWNGEATSKPDAVIAQFAQQLGLDMGRYNECVSTRKFQAQIQANYTEAERRGVPSTPSFFIGNQMVKGAVSYDQFKALVDGALAAQKPAANATPKPATKTK